MLKRLLLILLVIVPFIASAQYKPNKQMRKRSKTSTNSFVNKKKKPRPEFIVGLGAANFLGELGGANQIGTFFVRDLEFKATRPSAQVAIRYKFNNRFAVKGGLYYQLLNGSDKLTKEPYRNNRNLSFRSNVFELSGQLEFFITKEQQGARYKIKNAKGTKNYDFQAYLFLGAGGFFYNPQAKYHGNWVNLQPLGTEGQGSVGGPKKYSRVSFCIPYGIGVKEAITKEWSIGVEIGMRKTFTDYIDDVSGLYFDNSVIRADRGDMAADLADPSLLNYPESLGGNSSGATQTAAGQVRGHSNHKDAYMFLNLTASYKIPAKRRTRSKF
ncbi:hypothetical protein BH10BAC1_BH10BAC1_13410 [soil metagenome]